MSERYLLNTYCVDSASENTLDVKEKSKKMKRAYNT